YPVRMSPAVTPHLPPLPATSSAPPVPLPLPPSYSHPPPVFPPSLPSTSAPLLQTTPAQLPSAQNRPNDPTAFPAAFETPRQQPGPLPLSAHPSSANPTRSL